jgi:hypothetical protein
VRSEKRVIQQAYRFELDPNRAQRVLRAKSVGASRYVYNSLKQEATADSASFRLAEALGNRC